MKTSISCLPASIHSRYFSLKRKIFFSSFNFIGLVILLLCTCVCTSLYAQKITYKNDVLNVDGTDIGKIVRIKDKASFGLTSTYELDALTGEKLIIATIANDYIPNRADNTTYYYRFTFLTTNQLGIFSLSKLGPEKAFAKLVGGSGIVINDKLDSQRVAELIALKSDNPVAPVPDVLYHTVKRDLQFPVSFKDGGRIYQGFTLIGNFKKVGTTGDTDSYEFSIPEGLVIARVSFSGTNAKQFLISTIKDRRTQDIITDIDKNQGGTIISSIDINETALLRVTKWLIKAEYL